MSSAGRRWGLDGRVWGEEWRYGMTLCLAFSIPISQGLSTWVLILLAFGSVWVAPFVAIKLAWDSFAYIFLLAIGLTYSNSVGFGIEVIETTLSLIAMPVVLAPLAPLTEKRLFGLLSAFLAGVACSGLYLVSNALLNFTRTDRPESFQYYELTGSLDFQPTYFAYFLVLSITCGLFLMYYGKSPIPRGGLSIVVLFLFMILLLSGGRTSFISMLLVCAFFILKFLLERGNRWERLTFGIVVVIVVGLFFTTYMVGDKAVFNDSWDRYDLWKSAIYANPDVVWGVGTGDYKIVLNTYFVTHGMMEYASESLNAHNQFIQTYLSNGIVGLVALLIMMLRPLYMAFKRDNTLTILALFPFLIYAMTEVFLGRYQGVVFFAFVHQVFLAHLLTVDKPVRFSKPT